MTHDLGKHPLTLNAGAFLLRSTQALPVPRAIKTGLLADNSKAEQSIMMVLWMQRASPWWIGDICVYLESVLGDHFLTLLPTGFSLDMVERYMAVARKVPPSMRREELSWSHHAVVANLAPDQQKTLLSMAAYDGLSSGEFRQRVSVLRKTHGFTKKEKSR